MLTLVANWQTDRQTDTVSVLRWQCVWVDCCGICDVGRLGRSFRCWVTRPTLLYNSGPCGLYSTSVIWTVCNKSHPAVFFCASARPADLVENRRLWRMMSTYGATHVLCLVGCESSSTYGATRVLCLVGCESSELHARNDDGPARFQEEA